MASDLRASVKDPTKIQRKLLDVYTNVADLSSTVGHT